MKKEPLAKPAVGVIPARYGSTRFPGKPLAMVAKKPMIQWVYERSTQARLLDKVVVATDDYRIYNAVRAFGGLVQMTDAEHNSGTDRVAQVARGLDADIIINIQGDEPLIEPDGIDTLVRLLLDQPDCQMATLARPITDAEELTNPNTARVLIDRNGHALYFSRAALPFVRDAGAINDWPQHAPFYNHIGIYGYRKKFLAEFTRLENSVYEKAEKLEQLRALEYGYRIKVGIVDFMPVCVDVPADIEIVERKLIAMGIQLDG